MLTDYCEILPESTSAIQLHRLSELHWTLQPTRGRRGPGSVRRTRRCEMLRVGFAVFVHIICAKMWQTGSHSALQIAVFG